MPVLQGVYYQAAPTAPGQPGVRYMCPMALCGGAGLVQQGQMGYGPGSSSFTPEGATQAGQQQFCQQFVSQSFQGNPMYTVTSPTVMGQSCDYQAQCMYHMTSPTDSNNSATGYSYPVSYNSQQQTFVAPNQSQMFYTYQSPQQSNSGQPGQGFMYSGQSGTTYQSTSPPSQSSTVTPSVNMQQGGQGPQPHAVLQGAGMALAQSPGAHYMTFPSPQGGPHMPQNPHFHQPQTFSTPVRAVAPQFVPLAHTMPMGGPGPSMTLPHPFHQPLYCPNMQVPMQLHSGQPSQQGLLGPGLARSPGHVTVSARGLAECGDGDSTADTQAAFRQHTHSQGRQSVLVGNENMYFFNPQNLKEKKCFNGFNYFELEDLDCKIYGNINTDSVGIQSS